MSAQKTIIAHVYGKDYTLACDSGQEQHLNSLIDTVNTRAIQLEQEVGRLPESLMLLYTALMLADELYDTRRELTRAREELNRTLRQLESVGANDSRLAQLEEEVSASLHAIASRMEGLAEKLAV